MTGNTASVKKILSLLEKNYSSAETALDYETPVQMLVSTILSAQCTDERVNKVTPSLYAKYDTAEDYANADKYELEQIIRSTGFYKNKARNIIGACKMIVEKYDGKVPKTMDGMLALPGVARKTANVVLGNAYGIVDGIVVDTHVGRLARRLGFSSAKDANKVEKDLMKVVPRSKWNDVAYWLIDHGRAICKSRKPKCADCFLNGCCPSAASFDSNGKWIGPK